MNSVRVSVISCHMLLSILRNVSWFKLGSESQRLFKESRPLKTDDFIEVPSLGKCPSTSFRVVVTFSLVRDFKWLKISASSVIMDPSSMDKDSRLFRPSHASASIRIVFVLIKTNILHPDKFSKAAFGIVGIDTSVNATVETFPLISDTFVVCVLMCSVPLVFFDISKNTSKWKNAKFNQIVFSWVCYSII